MSNREEVSKFILREVNEMSSYREAYATEEGMKLDVIDSIDQVDLEIRLESEFGISIDDEEFSKNETLKDVIDYVCTLIDNKSSNVQS